MKILNLILTITFVFAMAHCKENKNAEPANGLNDREVDAAVAAEPAIDQANGDNAIEAKFVEAGLGDLAYYTLKTKLAPNILLM